VSIPAHLKRKVGWEMEDPDRVSELMREIKIPENTSAFGKEDC
jgi:hypothetical protein